MLRKLLEDRPRRSWTYRWHRTQPRLARLSRRPSASVRGAPARCEGPLRIANQRSEADSKPLMGGGVRAAGGVATTDGRNWGAGADRRNRRKREAGSEKRRAWLAYPAARRKRTRTDAGRDRGPPHRPSSPVPTLAVLGRPAAEATSTDTCTCCLHMLSAIGEARGGHGEPDPASHVEPGGRTGRTPIGLRRRSFGTSRSTRRRRAAPPKRDRRCAVDRFGPVGWVVRTVGRPPQT